MRISGWQRIVRQLRAQTSELVGYVSGADWRTKKYVYTYIVAYILIYSLYLFAAYLLVRLCIFLCVCICR